MIKGMKTIAQYKIAQYIEGEFVEGAVTMEPVQQEGVLVTDREGSRLLFYMKNGEILNREPLEDPAQVEECEATHREAFENWPHGEAVLSWNDEAGAICVQYSDGTWYHYKKGESGLEWW